jgi:hypothetical protein
MLLEIQLDREASSIVAVVVVVDDSACSANVQMTLQVLLLDVAGAAVACNTLQQVILEPSRRPVSRSTTSTQQWLIRTLTFGW